MESLKELERIADNYDGIIQLLVALGTISAVITSLHLAAKREKVLYRARIKELVIIYSNGANTEAAYTMEIFNAGFREFTLNGYFIYFKLPFKSESYAIRLEHMKEPVVLKENKRFDCLMMPVPTFRNETLPTIWETTKFSRFLLPFLKCGMATQDGTLKNVRLPKRMRRQIYSFIFSGAKIEEGYKTLSNNWWIAFEGIHPSSSRYL